MILSISTFEGTTLIKTLEQYYPSKYIKWRKLRDFEIERILIPIFMWVGRNFIEIGLGEISV
jgi:hypothetical protein